MDANKPCETVTTSETQGHRQILEKLEVKYAVLAGFCLQEYMSLETTLTKVQL